MASNFIQQWWQIKSVTSLKGTPVSRSEPIYHEPLFCCGFHAEYFYPDSFTIRFTYFTKSKNIHDLYQHYWETSPVHEIQETEDTLIIRTQNSIYTFNKVESNPFLDSTNIINMSGEISYLNIRCGGKR